MTTRYLQLTRESVLPNVFELAPFRAVVIIDEETTPEWQAQVSEWLVRSGCLYMMAWGKHCSSWDDSVDVANLETFGYGEIPDDSLVMTTWHEDGSLNDVFDFAKTAAVHPTVTLRNTILLHISRNKREAKLLAEYEIA